MKVLLKPFIGGHINLLILILGEYIGLLLSLWLLLARFNWLLVEFLLLGPFILILFLLLLNLRGSLRPLSKVFVLSLSLHRLYKLASESYEFDLLLLFDKLALLLNIWVIKKTLYLISALLELPQLLFYLSLKFFFQILLLGLLYLHLYLLQSLQVLERVNNG